MSMRFDPDGGDLGKASFVTSPFEFRIVVPYIANIFSCLYREAEKKEDYDFLPLKFCFAFALRDRPLVDDLIRELELNFPGHVKFYDCDGKKTFDMREASGGVVSGFVCYLVTDSAKYFGGRK